MPGRVDAFGDRLVMYDNTDAPPLELLRFRDDLAAIPGFDAELRERVRALAGLRHPAFVPARSVQRLDEDAALTLVSEHKEGLRLSELFERGRHTGVDPGVVAWLLRELTPALVALEAHGAGIGHGVLTPDRIVLTPEGRLCIVEHVLGGSLQHLRLERDALWRQFGVLAPGQPGPVQLDTRADLVQLGGLALSMLVGRQVTPRDVDAGVPALLDEVGARSAGESERHLPPLREWLERALDDEEGYRSAAEAEADLRELRVGSRSSAGAARALPAPAVAPEPALVAVAASSVPASSLPGSSPYLQEARTMRQYPDLPDIGDTFPSETTPPATTPPGPAEDAEDQIKALRARLASKSRDASTSSKGDTQLAPLRPARVPESREIPFEAPSAPAAGARKTQLRLPRNVNAAVAALAMVALGEGAVIAYLLMRAPQARPSSTLVIESPQPGAAVMVNGKSVGATPYQLTLGSGTQSVRVVPAGAAFEGAAATPSSGPAAAASAVAEGVAPPRAGDAGVDVRPAPPRQGGLRLVSPVELTVVQGDRVLGSTSDGPIYLAAGTHQVQLVNNTLGFKATQSITVRAGQVGTQRIDLPNGRLNLNAQPWARVFVDGTLVGETPLANVAVPIGDHEVLFRHPQLGERRERVTVRADSVVRVTANFN